jgi:FtsP/CotA-like multicopper oxidase with cupredoxin domain
MLRRRGFLGLGVAVGGASLLPVFDVVEALQAQESTGVTVPPFTTRMPVPATLRPAWTSGDVDAYHLALRPATAEILPGVRTEVMSYGGSYVGPTIRARSGRRVQVRYKNQLPMAANVHLHGGRVTQDSDGFPTDLIQPGSSAVYEYPNRQPGATLWYHDNTHMMAAEHMYRGLQGLYLLEDADERRLGLPGGEYDVPIMLNDAHFDDNGQLFYGLADAYNRTTILANGKPVPYFPVRARKYRLRLVNASIWRYFRLSLAGRPLTQIASDGGLLPAPVRLDEVVISPGERIEVVVDFGDDAPGTQLVLDDLAGAGSVGAGPVLRFDVTSRARDTSRVPDRLRPLPDQPTAAVTERRFDVAHTESPPVFTINGKPFDPNRIDATIKRGATEDWLVHNLDTHVGPPGGLHHNFHMHSTRFQVVDRDGKPPGPGESGLKDTVHVAPGETVRLRATFDGYLGRFAFHCQTIQHSHMGMMGQMEIIP